MEWIGFGFDLDLIWIEIAVLKNFKECARSPCNGNHFSSNIYREISIEHPNVGLASLAQQAFHLINPKMLTQPYFSRKFGVLHSLPTK